MKIGNLEVYGVIYKITNKVNGKVYIGQTIQGFDKRYKRRGVGIERVYRYHEYYSKSNASKSFNHKLFGAIKKYGFDNFKVDKIIDVAFSKNELDIKEVIWINYYNSFKNGYNKTLGGDGCCGVHVNKPSGSNNPCSKKIICLNDGKEFMGANEVSNHYNIHQTSINDCCLFGRRYIKSEHGNLIFRYSDDYEAMSLQEINALVDSLKREKDKVVCLNYKKIFNSIAEAVKYFNFGKRSNIGNCCLGKRRYCGTYNGEKLVWKYYNDYILMNDDEIKHIVEKVNSPIITCLTTGEHFYEVKDAIKKYNLNRCGLKNAYSGISKYCGKLEDGTKLVWEYYEIN